MTLITKTLAASALAGVSALALAGAAQAQGYVSGSAGANFQTDSDNSGAFTSDFTTGDGVAVPPGTVLPAGADLGWSTEFDTGLFLSAAYGWRFNDNWRVEGELSYRQSEVDSHEDLVAGGSALGAADAAVLITGASPLGVTVEDLLADGQGDLTALGLAVNGYYDFDTGSPLGLYVGAGAGFENVELDFSPSDTAVLDDDETVAFGQVMAGGDFPIADNAELYGGYRYRVSEDIETDVSLVPANLDVENDAHILEVGVRYSF